MRASTLNPWKSGVELRIFVEEGICSPPPPYVIFESCISFRSFNLIWAFQQVVSDAPNLLCIGNEEASLLYKCGKIASAIRMIFEKGMSLSICRRVSRL